MYAPIRLLFRVLPLVLVVCAQVAKAQTTTHEAYGVRFITNEATDSRISSDEQYLWKLEHQSGLFDCEIGILRNTRLKYVLPENPVVETSPVIRFAPITNAVLAKKPYKINYNRYQLWDREFSNAYIIFEISDELSLIFYADDESRFLERNIQEIDFIISTVSFPTPTREGRIAISATPGFTLKSWSVNGPDFINGNKGSGPRLRNGANDELLLIWSDVSNHFHLSRLNKKGELVRDMDFGNKAIYDAVAFEDGVTVLCAHPIPNEYASRYHEDFSYHHLYLEKYTWQQKLIFSTKLMGVDEIQNVNDQRFAHYGKASTRLAWSGEYYATYFATFKKWHDGIEHQGGAYILVDAKGKSMLPVDTCRTYCSTWDVSHNFSQELMFDGEKFVRFALGDAHPRAIAVIRDYPEKTGYYSVRSGNFSAFPGLSGDNYVFDTHLGNPFFLGDEIFLPYDTEFDRAKPGSTDDEGDLNNDIYLSQINRQCEETVFHRLSNTPDIEERLISAVPLDQYRVLCKWQNQRNVPAGDGITNNGEVWEEIGVYNLQSKVWEKKAPLKFYLGTEVVSSLSTTRLGEHYYPGYGNNGEGYVGSQLFQDHSNRIWFVRFIPGHTGFELVEVSD